MALKKEWNLRTEKKDQIRSKSGRELSSASPCPKPLAYSDIIWVIMELVSPAWGPAVCSKHGLSWPLYGGCVRFCVTATTWSHRNSVFVFTDSQATSSRAPYRESGCVLYRLAAQEFFICSWNLSISLPQFTTLAFSMTAMPILCAQHPALITSSRCSCPLESNNSVAWVSRFPGNLVGAENPRCFAILGTLF